MTRPAPPSHEECPLSDRELQVIMGVAAGLTNAEIGADLHLSMHTIKTHLARIAWKLDNGDRAGIVAICLRNGWIS